MICSINCLGKTKQKNNFCWKQYLCASSLGEDGHEDFAKRLEAINSEKEVDEDNDLDDMDNDLEDLITDKTDDVRVIVSLDGSKGDVDIGNR